MTQKNMNRPLPPQGLLAYDIWIQLTASICWILIDLIKCNLRIRSCVKINTLDSCFICPWRLKHGSKPYLWIGEAGPVHVAPRVLPGAVSTRYRLAQDARPVPLHLDRCDWAEGCVLTSDVQPRKGKPGQSFRSSCVSRPVVLRET